MTHNSSDEVRDWRNDERRGLPRLSERCRVAFRLLHDGQADPKTFAGETLNLSASGLCLESTVALERETQLALELSLDGSDQPVVAVGRVLRSEPVKPGAPETVCRAGIVFAWLRDEDRDTITTLTDFIEKRL